jgi:hypothetical protein
MEELANELVSSDGETSGLSMACDVDIVCGIEVLY